MQTQLGIRKRFIRSLLGGSVQHCCSNSINFATKNGIPSDPISMYLYIVLLSEGIVFQISLDTILEVMLPLGGYNYRGCK